MIKVPKPLGVLKKYPKPILKPDGIHWRRTAVFNPTAYIDKDGRIKLLYRAVGEYYRYVSRIGVAVSEDGYIFRYMSNRPLLYPTSQDEWWGVEDPRVSFVDGKIIGTYTMWNKRTTRIGIFEVYDQGDVVKAKKIGYIKSPMHNKNGVIMKVDDKLLLIHRPWYWGLRPNIWVSEITKYPGAVTALPSRSWLLYETPLDALKSGIGPAPIRLDNGEWLLLFHIVYPPEIYLIYAALADKHLRRITAFIDKPVLTPGNMWELHGDVPFVVFPCGAVVRDDDLYVYYGAGDHVVMMAHGSLSTLVDLLDKHRLE